MEDPAEGTAKAETQRIHIERTRGEAGGDPETTTSPLLMRGNDHIGTTNRVPGHKGTKDTPNALKSHLNTTEKRPISLQIPAGCTLAHLRST